MNMDDSQLTSLDTWAGQLQKVAKAARKRARRDTKRATSEIVLMSAPTPWGRVRAPWGRVGEICALSAYILVHVRAHYMEHVQHVHTYMYTYMYMYMYSTPKASLYPKSVLYPNSPHTIVRSQ